MEQSKLKAPKGYFKGKYCIYLDQFAVSNLTEDVPEWKNIKQLLEEGVGNGSMICPMPPEHFFETAGKNDQGAVIQNRYFLTLSEGYLFKQEGSITSQLCTSYVRKNNITHNTFCEKINPDFVYDTSLNKFRNVHAEYKKMIAEATSMGKEIRSITRDGKMSVSQRKMLFQVTKSLSVQSFTERLDSLLKKGEIEFQGVHFSTRSIPHWTEVVIDRLLKNHKMRKGEIQYLLSALKRDGFDKISTLDVRFTLEAYMAVHHKKENANDQFDIGRIASGIQISDVMLVDKLRKFELTELEFDKKYQTKIFSGVNDDLIALEKHLASIARN